MSSLESCIRKAGKALTKEDAKAIRSIRDDIVKTGRESSTGDVNQQAVDEYLDILELERDFIMQQIEAAGGIVADRTLSPSEFSKRVAKNLDEAARRFPRKGILRPPAETVVIDRKTGKRMLDDEENRQAAMRNMTGRNNEDPYQRVLDLPDMRTYRTIEMLYPDFYTLPPDQVLAIVNEFDPKAALSLAKSFDILPRSARKLIPANYNQAAIDRITTSLTDKGEIGPNGEVIRLRDDVDDWFYGSAGEEIIGWIEKNETLPLRYKVDDPFEQSLVDSHPDHPMAMHVKYQAVMDEAVLSEPGPVRRLVNKIIDSGEMTRRAILNAVPQTKIPDFMRYGMDKAKEYVRTNKKMDAWMNRIMEKDAELANYWLNFNQKNKDGARILGEFMHASSLSGVDVPAFEMPDAAAFKKMNKEARQMWLDRRRDYEILKPFWDRLGGMGEKTTYVRQTYNPETDKFAETGEPMEVSQAQSIYLRVRDTYSNQRQTLMYNLEKRINDSEADQNAKAELIAKLRQQFEAGLIVPYFPLSRFGKYHAYAKTKDGETVAFIKRESRRERNEWMERMRKKGFKVLPYEEQKDDLAEVHKIDPNFVATVTKLVKEQTIVDPKTGDPIPGTGIADQIWQMYLRTLPDLSARKAYIHRIGRLGFTHDALRAFADHTFHGTHQAGKLRFGGELNRLQKQIQESANELMKRSSHIRNWMEGHRPPGLEDTTLHEVMYARIPDYAKLYSELKRKAGVSGQQVHEPSHEKAMAVILREGDVDGPWAIPLAQELARRHAYNMNPRSSPLSTKLTAFGFFWFLSTSPAAGVLNLTQTAIAAYPILRARFSGKGAGSELLKASGEYLNAPTVEGLIEKLNQKGKQDPKFLQEAEAIREFEQTGMYSKTRVRDLMGLTEGGSQYNKATEKILETVGWIFHKTEEANRVATSLAAYRLSRSAGRSHQKAILEAEEMVEMSHFDYTNTNRPRFMQGDMGRVVFLFRNYSLNMQYRLLRDFRDGVWKNDDIPIEARKEAKSRLLGIMGMTTIFAGVSGLPLFWALEGIANTLLDLTDDDDEPWDVKTGMRRQVFTATSKLLGEVWGQKTATAIMKGPWSALTGADLSQRASLNNLWIREIPESKKSDPEAFLLHLMGELAGPLPGILFNYGSGLQDVFQNNMPERGMEKFFPKWFGDYMKAYRYATQGAQTRQRDIVLSPDEFTQWDLFMQAMGFSPTKLADRYDQNRAIQDMNTKLKGRRKKLLDKLFMAWKLEDRTTAREALQDIAEWNKRNPRYPISSSSIRQSARQRADYDARTVAGVAVEKRLQYLMEKQRFTARPEKKE